MKDCEVNENDFSVANPSAASKRTDVIGVNTERSEPKGSIYTDDKGRYQGRRYSKEKSLSLNN